MKAAWLRLDHAGLRWRVRPGDEPLILKRQWTPPAADGDGWRIVQARGNRVSALAEGLFVKWYRRRHAGEALRFALGASRPEAEWTMNGRLSEAGIPVADCLALGERRRFGLWVSGVLVLKAVMPPLTLAACLRTAPEDRARRLAAAAANLVAGLHDGGFCHHDLHGDNLLVDPAGKPERLLLVDLHEITTHAAVASKDWLADLARLNAYTPGSRNLRLRFWVCYAKSRRLPREHARAWLMDIERETRRLWKRHYRKRGESIERY